MSDLPSEGAHCAQHPETLASWTCGRCGSFMCSQCERRTRPEALPMCPTCWELRSRVVLPQKATGSGTALQTAGLVLGLLSLIPMCLVVQLTSVVLNLVALFKSKEPPARQVRWRSIVGLMLSCIGLVLSVLFWRA